MKKYVQEMTKPKPSKRPKESKNRKETARRKNISAQPSLGSPLKRVL